MVRDRLPSGYRRRSPGGWALLALAWAVASVVAPAEEFLPVDPVELQPLLSATGRLVEALDVVGAPLPADDRATLAEAGRDGDAAAASRTIQRVLDPLCLAGVTINAESRVSVVEGPAAKELVQQGWRTFLVKVANQAGITAELRADTARRIADIRVSEEGREGIRSFLEKTPASWLP